VEPYSLAEINAQMQCVDCKSGLFEGFIGARGAILDPQRSPDFQGSSSLANLHSVQDMSEPNSYQLRQTAGDPFKVRWTNIKSPLRNTYMGRSTAGLLSFGLLPLCPS